MTSRPAPFNRLEPPAQARAGAWSPNHAARALYIIRSAINQRQQLVRMEIGALTAQDIERPVRELQIWLATHPSPSHRAIVAFNEGRNWIYLRDLMPSTAGGAALLEEFQCLAQ